MKATESKTTTTVQSLQAKGGEQQPFFQQQEKRPGVFFGNDPPAAKPFFTPFIQTKLTIGQPGDKYEQEADVMAEKVVQRLSEPHTIQPQCAECTEEEKLQKKDGEDALMEQEEGIQRKSIFESNEEPAGGQVQRKCETCEAPSLHPFPIQRMSDQEKAPSLQAQAGPSALQASSDLEGRLNATKGGGSALPEETRSSMGSAFGTDFSGVRVHTNSTAVQMNQELGAQAFTHGSDVYFNAGKYSPGSKEGQRLLGHELTHVVQQGGGKFSKLLQRSPEDEGQQAYPIKVPKSIKSEHELDRYAEVLIFRKVMNIGWEFKGWDVEEMSRKGETVNYIYESSFVDEHGGKKPGETLKPGKSNSAYNATRGEERNTINSEIDDRYWQETSIPKGEYIKPGEEDKIDMWIIYRDQVMDEKKQLEQLPSSTKDLLGGGMGFNPKDYKQLLRISEKLEKFDDKDIALFKLQSLTTDLDGLEKAIDQSSSNNNLPTEDPEEFKRLFNIIQEKINDPQFSEDGESLVRFARFLEQNKDKIQGILNSGESGKLTEEKIEKIIEEYGKYIVAEPIEEEVDKLETVEDFDKKFKYDPGWQKLSKEDRKLLVEYAKANPSEITDENVDFDRVTTQMKISMALKLADTTFLGEVGQAAKDAFSDPAFVITLIMIVAVYVGLWLTPEPSGVTKVAAGILTVVLLSQFAWHDIYGFAKAWMALTDECSKAKTVEELKQAGDKFLKAIGPIGFDIALAIVMFGAGKTAGPRVSRIGLNRAKTRASNVVKAAEAKPGSGGKTPSAKSGSPKLPEKGTGSTTKTPTEMLDAFEGQLTSGARIGLKTLRTKLGDAKVLTILEGQQGKGLDINHFLTEKGMTLKAKAAAKAELIKAKARLMRLKLLELKVHQDPILRRSSKELRSQYKALEKLKNPAEIEAKQSIIENNMVAYLGEAMARSLLKGEYAARGVNVQIESNIEAVRELPGYRSIAEWKAAEIEAGKAPHEINTAKMREAQSKLWESIAEADALAVERTQSGKLKILESEQAKTGQSDRATEAKSQNTNFIEALKGIVSGDQSVKLFEKTGQAKIGKERTADFDLSDLSSIKETTRGLPEKIGFDKSMPESREVLLDVAIEVLQAGLPSLESPLPLPDTSNETEEKND